jgi:ubiquinone/menaquinone biosynthesis C-methylase UbiE
MNYSAWARWYDIAYSTVSSDDVDFYTALAKEIGSPVLEIGTGTGRISLPITQAGIDIVGIDQFEPMLDVARRKLADLGATPGGLELLNADMRTLDLQRKFNFVFAPARVLLLALTPEDQLQTLRSMATHTEPDGRVAFNFFVPNEDMIHGPQGFPYVYQGIAHPVTGNRVLFWVVDRWEPDAQTNHGLHIFEELNETGETVGKTTIDVAIRYIYPTEAIVMIEDAGMVVEEAYGDFDRSPLTEESSEQIYICRPA